jgi:UDP-N-acetylglucosamine 4-epimerase
LKPHPVTAFSELQRRLASRPRTWLITGVAGFIGSNLLETLLNLDQSVVGLDNFATGFRRNLGEVQDSVSAARWSRFAFIEGDIRRPDDCRRACTGVDHVLHQAALGSVPRSVADPLTTHEVNVTGFLNMISAARDAKAESFTYASSSSVYGDHPALPKIEGMVGRPLSPYAASKRANELYAQAFASCYGLNAVGLRYFNVFGPRQDFDGAYAAVIPKWAAAIIMGEPVFINGDGETSRDFCFVENAIQANLLAATTCRPEALNEVYNVAVGEETTLNKLYHELRRLIAPPNAGGPGNRPIYRELRAGDVRHSRANIDKAQRLLGYAPTHNFDRGVVEAIAWYCDRLSVARGRERFELAKIAEAGSAVG